MWERHTTHDSLSLSFALSLGVYVGRNWDTRNTEMQMQVKCKNTRTFPQYNTKKHEIGQAFYMIYNLGASVTPLRVYVLFRLGFVYV